MTDSNKYISNKYCTFNIVEIINIKHVHKYCNIALIITVKSLLTVLKPQECDTVISGTINTIADRVLVGGAGVLGTPGGLNYGDEQQSRCKSEALKNEQQQFPPK